VKTAEVVEILAEKDKIVLIQLLIEEDKRGNEQNATSTTGNSKKQKTLFCQVKA
jgi:hypothetical protein